MLLQKIHRFYRFFFSRALSRVMLFSFSKQNRTTPSNGKATISSCESGRFNLGRFSVISGFMLSSRKISLADALCGYSTVIQHLDGRHLVMSSVPGEVIQPGKSLKIFIRSPDLIHLFSESIRGILGEGMPKTKAPAESSERGNLYVIFDVIFPDNHFLADTKFKVTFHVYLFLV